MVKRIEIQEENIVYMETLKANILKSQGIKSVGVMLYIFTSSLSRIHGLNIFCHWDRKII